VTGRDLTLFDFKTVRDLLPYLWPKDAPALRRAVVYSLLCLIAAKVVTSLVPLTYKALVDHLDGNAATIAVPIGLVLAYGGARLMDTVFEELRIAVFTRVSSNATRLLGLGRGHQRDPEVLGHAGANRAGGLQ
jgi:ATP-binding cassette subfamily B protein